MQYKVNSLISTIKYLESLVTAEQRNVLLNKMQVTLSDTNNIMTEQHLLDIIKYLSESLRAGGLIKRLQDLNGIDCFELASKDTGLAFSLSFVGNPITEEFDLCILTNKKYSERNSGLISKHSSENYSRRLGKGTFKVVNSCLLLVISDGVLNVNLAARATAHIDFLIGGPSANDVSAINERLNSANTFEDILSVLSEFSSYFRPDILAGISKVYKEVKITSFLKNMNSVDPLRGGIPFVKHNSGGSKQKRLKVHFFDTVATHRYHGKIINSVETPGYLDNIKRLFPDLNDTDIDTILHQCQDGLIPDVVELTTDQLLYSITEMHDKGFVHRDLKPLNLLLDGPVHNPRLKIVDWGAAIDTNRIRAHTQELLSILGFADKNNGLVQGELLEEDKLDHILYMLMQQSQLPTTSNIQKTLNFESLNKEIQKIFPGASWLGCLGIDGTLAYAAPELCYYFDDGAESDDYSIDSLAIGILKILNLGEYEFSNSNSYKMHDIWAAGVSIVEYCLIETPLLSRPNTIAFIENNELLQKMLHPNPRFRCTTDELLEIRNRMGRFVIPAECDVERLAAQYKQKILEYKAELNDDLDEELDEDEHDQTAARPIIFSKMKSEVSDDEELQELNKRFKMSV